MSKNINYLELSYPNFVLGQIIDPDEANQNNSDIVNKINEFVDEVEDALETAENAERKADEAIVTAETLGNEAISKANEAIGTANQANTKSDSAIVTANQAKSIAENVQLEYTTILPEIEQAIEDSVVALSHSNEAIDASERAETKSEGALLKANYATDIAENADRKSDTAITTSNDAKTIAESADTKSDNAISVSGDAKTTSESADVKADNAVGIASGVKSDYDIMRPELEQAIMDVSEAVQAVSDKASVEYVNNKSIETINYVINEVDRKEPVDTVADLYTTYPDAEDGWICLVRSTRNQYMFNGVADEWEVRLDEITYADESGTDGIITSETFVAIQNKADKSNKFEYNISSSSWYDGGVNISNSLFNNSSIVEMIPRPRISKNELLALQLANIVGSVSGGVVKLMCFGKVPTIDVGVEFIVRGDM